MNMVGNGVSPSLLGNGVMGRLVGVGGPLVESAVPVGGISTDFGRKKQLRMI